MAAPQRYLSSLTRSTVSSIHAPVRPNPSILPFLCPFQQQSRGYKGGKNAVKSKAAASAKKKKNVFFHQYDQKDAIKFSLCDAMRYIRAFEVGKKLSSVKYELAVKLRTRRTGPVIRNQMRLPHTVNDSVRVCVICEPGSRAAKDAAAAGANIIGEDEVFEAVKAGKIEFDVCICHAPSQQNMNKAGLGRILGPKGLMPTAKLGTVVDNVGTAVRNLRGGNSYREREGVVRMAVGQLGFSPEELKANIGTFMAQLKKEAMALSDQGPKEISEVVLSSTHAPGFSLNGEFKTDGSPSSQALTGA
ncbi:ribosomal protein L1 [Polytolypa hystricis UAMH7299]|uniref:Ribosomal protein L1 n=1 Tax=Polytolypa hystricis (strain UAMH7299) TaxID=1447883 RepID=A0A2B7Z0P2_POLH7|nr:ribosomal protein L1 [Polytolypa hystricis UAMH7299]